jgi:hypothetical protein
MRVTEMIEFASFEAKTQRYIRRSLDVALGRCDAVKVWSRNHEEETSIYAQERVYVKLDDLRKLVPTPEEVVDVEEFIAPLIFITAFDLSEEQLPSFNSYRFLYERLLGALVRPWLPTAFCGAAALPYLRPETRKGLLQSISEASATASGWSPYEPTFFPEWVDKVEQFTA